MAENPSPQCTVIITPRDRLSCIEHCLNNVFKHTLIPVKVILVAGGLPEKARRHLQAKFKDSVEWVFHDRFMNMAEQRNIGLRMARTETAACIDTDVYVRHDWLRPLMDCYRQTGAALISPVVLDRQGLIHTAGTDFYITESEGKKHVMAELSFVDLPVLEKHNIKRRQMDYAEVHCNFVHVEKALRLGIYDERFREGGDYDSGLTLQKAGEKIMLEPASTVYLYYPMILDDLRDLDIYLWKWDLGTVMENYRYFEKKWGLDVLSKGVKRDIIIMLNHRVGFCTRLFQSNLSIAIDLAYYRAKLTIATLPTFWRKFKNRALGLENA